MAYLYILVERMPFICTTRHVVGDTDWSTETICLGLVTWKGLGGVFLERPRHGLQLDLAYMHDAHVGVSQFSKLLGMMPNFSMRLRRLKERCLYL